MRDHPVATLWTGFLVVMLALNVLALLAWGGSWLNIVAIAVLVLAIASQTVHYR
jgi:hypothetical protein